MRTNEYIESYMKFPFNFSQKKLLWNDNSIPIASNGKRKDWFYVATSPFYPDLDKNG
jgi:hypothetical protein